MKYITGLLAMLLPILAAAQSPQVKALSIGDTVPDITITNVYNYPSATIRLSDLKGKLVILDFWATWCGSCLNSFPEMEDLKNRFGDKIQILFVNSFSNDTEAKVAHTFTNLHKRTGRNIQLPYVLKDSLLCRYFPHKYVPHYVWLSSSRQVLAITGRDAVNTGNIRAVLDGKQPSLIVKNDKLAYKPGIPLLVDGNGGDDSTFLYRSIVTKYKENLGETGGLEVNEAGLVTKFYLIDTHILTIIKEANPEMRDFKAFQIKFNVPNPNKYKYFKDREKQKENSFCYELICPPASIGLVRKYIRSDLQKFFNITVTISKRITDGYNLKAINLPDNKMQVDTSYSEAFNKQPVKAVISLLEGILQKPVSDQTAISSKINFKYPKGMESYSLEMVNQVLEKNGFYLVPAKQNINIAVIMEDQK
jgi:thiol-disulfide isomerase/thioredoxin